MLRELVLGGNTLTGLLPREIGRLDHLEALDLAFNNFTGSIPLELFNMSSLQVISLSDNGLFGGLPMNLCLGLPVLNKLYLAANNFTGSIPVSNCSQLTVLELSDNKFTGSINVIGDLRLLELVNLARNNLTSESSPSGELSFITSLTNCRALNLLAVEENPLGGIIPASIGNLSSSFQRLFAASSKIKGKIPAQIGNLSNLVTLALSENEITGDIPVIFKHLHHIQLLQLSNNKMEGTIPKGICDLHRMTILVLSGNQFSGPIPECLGNVTSLWLLSMGSNLLSSSIPSSLWRLRDLQALDLSSNSLSGHIHQDIGNLVAITKIYLTMNQLSGGIPSTIISLQSLQELYLAHNRLEGPIPASVGNMISLITLDLSYNNLSGSIPKSMGTLKYLKYFNVSFNALRGEIPSEGPFRNFSLESFKGNEALCGIPRFHVPLCRTVSEHRRKRKRLLHAILISAGVVSLIIMVLCLTFILIRCRKKDKSDQRGIGGLEPNVPVRISYYELLQATEQFSESNLLGTGAFGSVYRGILRNGKPLAVKVFDMRLRGVFKSFDVECEVLRNLRHRNLTKVITSCSNEEFKALVLEYMPKGSLEKWLYSDNHCLDFMQRFDVMINVASALEYLHHGYVTPIVHCDLKPSNVLLDEEMVGHVSDFGIAKLLDEGESIVRTNTLATLGYMAPEYGFEGLVSTACDVYSYGIMLMETFTRKRPTDDMFVGDVSLRSWIERSLFDSSCQVIDSNLLNPEEQHYSKKLQCVSSVMELALRCSTERPTERLNMKEALAQLQKIKKSIFSVR